jgi:hypothetical protein
MSENIASWQASKAALLALRCGAQKQHNPARERLGNHRRLSAAGWTWGCVATIDREGRTIYVADAHRDDGRRFVVHAEEKLTAFVELEAAVRTK